MPGLIHGFAETSVATQSDFIGSAFQISPRSFKLQVSLPSISSNRRYWTGVDNHQLMEIARGVLVKFLAVQSGLCGLMRSGQTRIWANHTLQAGVARLRARSPSCCTARLPRASRVLPIAAS